MYIRSMVTPLTHLISYYIINIAKTVRLVKKRKLTFRLIFDILIPIICRLAGNLNETAILSIPQ